MIPLADENPLSIRPVVTWSLIALNVLIFLWQIAGPRAHFLRILFTYGFVPADVFTAGTYYMFLTSMFLHGDFLHLGGNMLYLWIFGDNIEDLCGHGPYVIFYLISGAAASLLYSMFAPDPRIPAVGASGAISGILGGYVLLFPHARIRTVVFGWGGLYAIRLPAYHIIGFWFLFQLLYALVGAPTGIAYWAHVGGFIAGFALIRLFARRRRLHPLYRHAYRFPSYAQDEPHAFGEQSQPNTRCSLACLQNPS